MNNFNGNPVLGFAVAMQKELDENDHKRGWQGGRGNPGCNYGYFIKRLKQEIGEVERAIKANKPTKTIISECADVANFAMMIADNYEPD